MIKLISKRLYTIVLPLVLGLTSCSQNKIETTYFPAPNNDLEEIHSELQSFSVDTVVSGLDAPYSMVFLPDKSMLITEREGKLRMVRDGQLSSESIGGNVPNGLRDIVLHPLYEENGWIYISYYSDPTDDDGAYTFLMRAKLKDNKLVDDEILYKTGPFNENGVWYGSTLAFDSNGYLFFTVGQRGIGKLHRWLTAQDLSLSSGKIMRFNDDGSIPKDNPFVDNPDALPEIYSYGHRQPQGLVLHPSTNELWSHEHGENGGDELNILKAGANYGWPDVTFSTNYDNTPISQDTIREGIETPVHYWTPAISPLSMAFIHGGRYEGWEGDLFVGSGIQRMLNHSVMKDGKVVKDEILLKDIGRVRDVKIAADRYLYVLTEDTGLIVRILPVVK